MDQQTGASRKRMSDAPMVSRIGEIVARVRKNPALSGKITGSADLINEIGLDSLEMIDFLLACEEEFQIQVDFDALAMHHLASVDALCDFFKDTCGYGGSTAADSPAVSSLPPSRPTSGTDDDRGH